jgi:hypothetical protein
MTPFSFEWQWNIEYFIFMGLLYLALFVVGCGLVYVILKTWLELDPGEKSDEVPPEISYRSRYAKY